MRPGILFVLFLSVLFSFAANSQSWRNTPWELYAGFGSANYFGDIGGAADDNNWMGIRDIQLFRSRPSGIGGLRYQYSSHFSFSGSVALGWLSGSDKGGKNETRNYVFNTIFFEPSGRIEFFPLRDYLIGEGVDRRGFVRNYATITAYLFTGAGAVFYHVMPNDHLKARQERDNIEYWPVTIVLPLGAGVRFGISGLIDIGFEIGGRYAMNDYLDGFTSKFASANDIYYLATVQVVYRLRSLRINDE